MQLQIYGHIAVISSKELSLVNSARLEDPNSNMEKITVQLVLVNEDRDGNCIIVVDRLRLTTLTSINTTDAPWFRGNSKLPVQSLGAISLQRDTTRLNSLQSPMTQYSES